MSSWTADNLLEAVCSATKDKPEICFKSGFFSKKDEKSSVTLIVFIIIIILIINVVIFIFCRRYISKRISDRIGSDEMDSRINNVVTSYLAFKDQKN